MKRTAVIVCALALCSCARFSTKQTDMSYGTNGTPSRAITTHASAYTFWSSSSELSKFKASQTDKTQSAIVGSLNQTATEPTNALGSVERISSAVVEAAIRAAR